MWPFKKSENPKKDGLNLNKLNAEWKFDQARNAVAVTTKKVMLEKYPILMVVHYEDDDSWSFTCGTTNKSEDLMLVSMGTVVDLDVTLKVIADLPAGWSAERKSVDSNWIRTKDESN